MQQYQPLDFFNFDGFQPDSVVENKRANQTNLISLDSKRREICFNLTNFIKDRDDWDSAYYIAKEIIDRSPDKQHSTLIKVASKMLLSGALLFAFSTLYPDILRRKEKKKRSQIFISSLRLQAEVILRMRPGIPKGFSPFPCRIFN